MIIDINILKRLGKRFGVFPISAGHPALQAALMKPAVVFIKAPAGVEPAITGGGYQWDDELNGYRFGTSQKLFLAPDGTTIWTFKDVLFRGLGLDSVQKWTSGDAEYPMGKANAFFIVYGKLTGQDLGEGETAGDNVPDGETEPGDGGGLATADDENAPPYSKQDIQKILKGEFPADTQQGPKASMATSIPGEAPSGEEPEASAPMSGPPPSRLAKGNPPVEAGSEAEKIIKTLYKQAKINPNSKLSKQNPIRLDGDAIIDLYQRAKKMAPEEGEKLIAFLKSGAVLPLEEGKIAKYQLERLVETIVGGIVGEVEKAKQKAKAKKKVSKPASKPANDDYPDGSSGWQPPEHSQMDWDSGGEKGNIPGRGAEQQWLEDLANKLWKDAEDIGHSHQGWKVKKVVPHGDGTKAYLLTLTKQYHKSRIFINRNGRWFWTDPVDRHNGWQEVEGPQTEPSIEQEQSGAGGGAGGMTTTSAVSPVTGPNAFKKKWTEKFQGRQEKEEEQLSEMTTTSGGGGSSAGTPGYQVPGAFGKKMSNRKGHIEVLGYKMTALGEKEYNTPADKLYEAIKQNIHRMIRESIEHKPEGGKCPHCGKDIWSKDAMTCSSCKKRLPEKPVHKPGNKGVGIAPLQQEGGRTCPHCNMLAVNGIWTHEQGCPASKKRVKEASGLGADFDRAQAAYDNQMPKEEPEIECPECGGNGFIKDKGHRGSCYWWSATCQDCGHEWGDDNFDDVRDRRLER
jgi:DNA-directed RNA polymerase subunit RPC12/RpoP